jgi:hypothetical protein
LCNVAISDANCFAAAGIVGMFPSESKMRAIAIAPSARYCQPVRSPNPSRSRCLRPNPDPEDGGLPIDWEVLVDADGEVLGVICEDCITPEEQQATDAADMALDAEISGLSHHCARCLRAVPYETDDPAEPLPDGWRILDNNDDVLLVLCPDCLKPSDELVS